MDTTIQYFQIPRLVHNAIFGNYNGDYGHQECDKLSPFRMTSRRKWRQIVGMRMAKTIRLVAKFQIISPLFNSKWKTTIRTALTDMTWKA